MKKNFLVFLLITLIFSVCKAQEAQKLISDLPLSDKNLLSENEVPEETGKTFSQKENSVSTEQNSNSQSEQESVQQESGQQKSLQQENAQQESSEQKYARSESGDQKKKSSVSYYIFDFPESQPFCIHDTTSFLVTRSNNNGIFLNALTVSVFNEFDFSYGKNISAFQLTEDSTSFIFENIFYFLRSYKKTGEEEILNPYFRLGADLHFSYEYQSGVSSKYNLFYGLAFDLKPSDFFAFNTRLFLCNRFSHILLGQDSFWIKNWDFQCECKFIFKVEDKWFPFVSFSTFEEFRYPLFCAPIFSAGCTYNLSEKLEFGASISIRYIDFFTLSSYADSWVVKVFASYKFL